VQKFVVARLGIDRHQNLHARSVLISLVNRTTGIAVDPVPSASLSRWKSRRPLSDHWPRTDHAHARGSRETKAKQLVSAAPPTLQPAVRIGFERKCGSGSHP
jgi:hypothetical protein